MICIFNPFALRKAKSVCNFGLSECNRVKSAMQSLNHGQNKVSTKASKSSAYKVFNTTIAAAASHACKMFLFNNAIPKSR